MFDSEVELEKIFAAGDAWLMKYGVVSPIFHNNIVSVLYASFPKVLYVEYFLKHDCEPREIKIVLYLSFWNCIFMNKAKFIRKVGELLEQYLFGYQIDIRIKRKRG